MDIDVAVIPVAGLGTGQLPAVWYERPTWHASLLGEAERKSLSPICLPKNDHRRKRTKKDETIRKPPIEGVLERDSRKPNEHGLVSLKPLDPHDLAFSDSFGFFHPFASFLGRCKRNDTRNVTRPSAFPHESS